VLRRRGTDLDVDVIVSGMRCAPEPGEAALSEQFGRVAGFCCPVAQVPGARGGRSLSCQQFVEHNGYR
jgi:hypothetical protein